MATFPLKYLILTSLLCSALSDEDLLNLHHQDSSLDPTVQDSSNESHRLSPNDKRTIFSNLLNHNNYALARHFVYRNGVKYLLGYGQVDLRYTPHFKPVYIKPRPVLPWLHTSTGSIIHNQLPKPLTPVPIKPAIINHHPPVVHHDAWKPLQIIPIPTSKPTVWNRPSHIPSTTLQEERYHPGSLQPIKLNLPVLPFGAMFLTPVLPNHQQQLQYYPFPITQPLAQHVAVTQPILDQHVHIHNPHPLKPMLPIEQPAHYPIVPGSSYEVHGYQPHHHVTFIPPTVIPQEHQHVPVYEEPIAEFPHYHTVEDHVPQEVTVPDHQAYIGSLEFHGRHSYQDHSIQPGETDVQIPVHLAQHPNYRPEDYYSSGQYHEGHVAGQRSDDVVLGSRVTKAPFKPSQRIYSYKVV